MARMDQWRMKDEGEVVEWIPCQNGEYIGIVKGDDGGVYTIKSADCANPGHIRVGVRVRFTFERFRNDDGDPVTGTDMESGQQYQSGSTRDVEIA